MSFGRQGRSGWLDGRLRAFVLLALLASACSGGTAVPGGGPADAITTGPADPGALADAFIAPVDAGMPDAGTTLDPGSSVDPGTASPDPGGASEVPAVEGPVLQSLDPASGPAGEVVTVTLHGSGFADGMEVWFGDQRALYPFVIADGVANVSTPASPPGTVAVRVVNPDGRFFVKPAAYRFESALTLATIDPASGPESGGTPVTVRGSGFSGAPVFLFGGRAAIGVRVIDDATALVVTPPHAPGVVSVIAVGDGVSARVPRAFEYLAAPVPVLDGVAVTGVSPASGPAEGGTTVSISGSGFAAGDAVRIGALPATSVVVESAVRIAAVTPPGSPGPADVVVVRKGAGAALPRGFTYDGGPTRVLAVEPENGSWAGGTRVRVYGFGLQDVAHVVFGAVEATEREVVSPVEVVARTPRAEAVGPVAVTVFGGGVGLGESAFSYFDPTLKGGGTWGGPVDGDLNVTVMSGFTGAGLPQAYVSVGTDVHGVFQGRTDDRGQLTFSEIGLAGPRTVHATAEGFSASSVADFDARNVTLYVYPPPSPEDLTQPPDSGDSDWRCKVRGRILDYDKHFLRPPWLDGIVYVTCRASNYSMFGGSADPGPKATADADGRFEVLTGSGEFALSCWMMALETSGAKPAYPLKVGLVRHLKCEYLGPDLEDVEVRLDHDTDAELWLSPGGLPEHPAGLNGPYWSGGWELGTDGYLDVIKNPVQAGARQLFDHQPRPFDADLEGAGYSFYANVSAATGVPYGVAMGTGIAPPVDWPLLVGEDAGFLTVPTTLRRTVTAMLPVGEGALLLADSGGSTYSFDGTTLFVLPNPTHRPIRALVGASADDWWAVGDRGAAWRFSSGMPASIDTGIPTDLLAASGPSADAFSVAGGDVLADWDGTQFVPAPVPWGLGLRAVLRFASGGIAAAGDGGSLVRGTVGGPFAVSWITDARFEAIGGTSMDDLWIAGSRGTLLHAAGDVLTVAVAPGEPDLHGVIVRGPCDVLVFGDRGAIFAYDCNAFSDLSRPDAATDLVAGAQLDGRPVLGGRRYASLEGFLPFEAFADPAPDVAWGRQRLAWTPLGTTGVAPSFHQVYLTNDLGMPVWILMASGETTSIDLPNFGAMIGYDPVTAVGASFLNLTAVAAPGFSIDRYSTTEMGFYRRTAYTTNYMAIP